MVGFLNGGIVSGSGKCRSAKWGASSGCGKQQTGTHQPSPEETAEELFHVSLLLLDEADSMSWPSYESTLTADEPRESEFREALWRRTVKLRRIQITVKNVGTEIEEEKR
jgi:hypothetical protein